MQHELHSFTDKLLTKLEEVTPPRLNEAFMAAAMIVLREFPKEVRQRLAAELLLVGKKFLAAGSQQAGEQCLALIFFAIGESQAATLLSDSEVSQASIQRAQREAQVRTTQAGMAPPRVVGASLRKR